MTAEQVVPWSLPAYPVRVERALAALAGVAAILTGTDGGEDPPHRPGHVAAGSHGRLPELRTDHQAGPTRTRRRIHRRDQGDDLRPMTSMTVSRARLPLLHKGSGENRRRPAGNRASNPAGLSNGASRMIIAPPLDGLSQAHRSTPTSVYRYYDRSGLLLYIGVTSRGNRRNVEHYNTKDWWPFVASQAVDHFGTRQEALDRERELIRKYRPPFNTQHNPDHEMTRAVYLARYRAPGQLARLPKRIRCVLLERTPRGQPVLRSELPPLDGRFRLDPL